MEEFSIFKTFRNMDEAKMLIQLLEEKKIKFSIIDNSHDVDITFTGNNNNHSDIQLLIQQGYFEQVQKLLEAQIEAELNNDDTSHYLYEFTKEELFEILEKKDEWSNYDFVLAKKILKERGENISDEAIAKLQLKREEKLSKGEEGPVLQIVAGYIFVFFGGLLGFIIGWSLWKSKKTLPTGEKVFTYTDKQRSHGKNMVYLGIFLSFLWSILLIIIYKVNNLY